MEDDEIYSKKTLYRYSYRHLQQLAKSMSLPCNFKKVYLIELIRAKKFGSDSEVNSIVQRVKLERQHLAEVRRAYRKANLKKNELNIKKPPSPPITTTPKRTGLTMCCSPDLCKCIIKYNPKQALVQGTQKTYPLNIQNGSDRVLRSSNFKTINKNANIYNVNKTVLGVYVQNRVSPKETRFEIVCHEGNLSKFNDTAKYVVKNHKPSAQDLGNPTSDRTNVNRQMSQLQANSKSTPLPSKRQRKVSGIYPLVPKETPAKLGYLQSHLILRGSDGKISKIPALVQKLPYKNIRKPEINLQDIENCKIDVQNTVNSNLTELDANMNNNYLQLQYPMIPSVDKAIQCNLLVSQQVNVRPNEVDDRHSVNCHKKISAEQVICNESLITREQYIDNDRLPKINDVFTRIRDVTQPLYVQVYDEPKTINMHHICPSKGTPKNNTDSGLVECIFNFRSQYLFNKPLLQIATTSNTKSVFSTSITATPRAEPSSTVVFGEPSMASGEGITGDISREEDTHDLESPEASCASIPDMLEDALEVISQDGDYIERIGVNEKVECMLCSWAGPMLLLEYHIKKDHSDQIYKVEKNEWNITFTLGSLVQSQRQIVEYETSLYIVSARYEDPDCFIASISTLTFEPDLQRTGSITIYNKVTGEPHIWEGPIQSLEAFEAQQFQLQNQEAANCLRLELSRLDLLPNSANLKLLNRELVNDSPNKVVVGQPELNDIHIILFIKILD